MSNSMQSTSRGLAPRPPDKGSFPLDHGGVCKPLYTEYMACLKWNFNLNDRCRHLSHQYFKCRMDNNLMAREDFEKLGYTPADYVAPPPLTDTQRAAIQRAIDAQSYGWREETVSGLNVHGDPNKTRPKHIIAAQEAAAKKAAAAKAAATATAPPPPASNDSKSSKA